MRATILCDHTMRPEYRRHCRPRTPLIRLSCDPSRGNVYLDGDAISAAVGQPLDSVTLDLCEIAAYVYVADKAVPRSEAHWVRDLAFVVPVRNPDLWNSVNTLLTNTVATLSGDNTEFRFVRLGADQHFRGKPSTRPRTKSKDSNVDCSCLFSGGLDSLAGAVHLLKEGRRPLFTSHYVSVLKKLQGLLMEGIRQRFGPAGMEHFQYRVTSKRPADSRLAVTPRESSHRARSFLYLTFGTVAAAVRNLRDVFICENGILALNVPISEARKGSRSTRHAHPLYIHYFNELVNKLYGREFAVRNPFQYLTKKEEIESLNERDLLPLIGQTVSCWGYPNQTITFKNSNHCGYCIPCIVRRLSLISAGLARFDDRYAIDVLARNGDRSETHVRNITDLLFFCQELQSLSHTELIRKHPEFVMIEVGFGKPGGDRLAKIIDVYKRFAKEVLSATSSRNTAPPVAP